MDLKELRNKCKMTQKEASFFLKIPLRTYSRYENEVKYRNTLAYDKMCDILSEKCMVDETHGILSIEEITRTVRTILEKYDINFCYLFGSYAKNKANECSDVDLLIDSNITGLNYYGLLQDLIDNLHKQVDLIKYDATIKNEILLKEIMKDGIKIYG